jgi:uncharacterized protein (TIGR02246 family)
MKRISLMTLLLATTLVVATPFVAFSQNTTAKNEKNTPKTAVGKGADEVLKMERECNQASQQNNLEAMMRMQTDDYMKTFLVPPQVLTRTDFIAEIKESANQKPWVIDSLIDDDVKVRTYGDDTAIVTGIWKRVSKDAEGKDTSGTGRFTRVWVKQNGRWQLAGEHYSPFRELAPRK